MSGSLGADEGAHEGAVRPADMCVEHVEVALVCRQVHRLAYYAARMMQPRDGLVQLHQRHEILIARIAAAAVEIMHEGRPPRRTEHRGRAAKLHVVGRVAGQLDELRWRAGLDGPAAESPREANPAARYVTAGIAENLEDLVVADELHAGILENGVGIRLDEFETLFAQYTECPKLAVDVGRAQLLHPVYRSSALAARSVGGSHEQRSDVIVPKEFHMQSEITIDGTYH